MKTLHPAPFVALLTILTLGHPAVSIAQAPVIRAFLGASIIDGTGNAPIANGTLIVRDGRIAAIGPGAAVSIPESAQRIDLAGKTIMPGIINAHGHAGSETESKLARYARYGVTTVVSLGGEDQRHVALRDAQSVHTLDRSRLFIAGQALNSGSTSEAQNDVDAMAALGVDWIKLRVNFGSMPAPVYRTLIEQAHRHDLKVAAHIVSLEDAKGLLRSGADNLAHSIRDREVDAGLIALMRDNDVCLTPTLTREVSVFAYDGTPEFFSDPFFLLEADSEVMARLQNSTSPQAAATGRAYLEMAQHNLAILSDAGVGIALGTDSGTSPGRFVGYFEHLEMELMAQAGMAPLDVIYAATGGAAACMDLAEDLGTLEAGKWGDFMVLEASPLQDIRNTRTLESVWIAGNRVPGAVSQESLD